jgi:type IV secretion system protein VirD4
LGKQTICTKTSSVTHGRNRSSSLNYGIHGRDLITPDEIGLMPDSDCILLIRGIKPFKSKKYIINEHVNYPQLGDGNKNNFDYRNIVTEVSEEDVMMMYALREPEPEPQEEFFPIKDLAFTTYELENLHYEAEYEN